MLLSMFLDLSARMVKRTYKKAEWYLSKLMEVQEDNEEDNENE